MSIVSLDAAACCVLRAGCHRPVLHILDRLNLQAERVLSPAARSPAGPAGPAPHDTLTWDQFLDEVDEVGEHLMLIQVTAQTQSMNDTMKEREAQRVVDTLKDDVQKVANFVFERRPNQTGSNSGSEVYQEQLGLKTNSSLDVETLRTSFVFNLLLILTYLVAFALLQHFQPIVYLDNSRRGRSPEPRPSYYGCTLSRDEIQALGDAQ
eukprot:g24571.t1